MSEEFLFTSESVSEGHPDKVSDIVSDSIVDDFMSQSNPENARVAVETLVTTNKIVVAGEVRGPENYNCKYEELEEMLLGKLGMSNQVFTGKIYLLNHMYIVNHLI